MQLSTVPVLQDYEVRSSELANNPWRSLDIWILGIENVRILFYMFYLLVLLQYSTRINSDRALLGGGSMSGTPGRVLRYGTVGWTPAAASCFHRTSSI